MRRNSMRKRSIFIVIFVVIVSLALMGLDVYENKKEATLKAEAEKIYTVSDIMKDADFNADKMKLGIGIIDGNIEDYETIFIEEEEQRKKSSIIFKTYNYKYRTIYIC